MRMNPISLGAALLVGAALSAAAQLTESGAFLRSFAVNGTVAGASDLELVVLLDERGLPVARTVAGAGGRFELRVQRAGEYQLAIQEGRQFHVLEQITLNSAQPVVTVQAASPRPFEILERRQAKAPVVDAGHLGQQVPKKARRLYNDARRRVKQGDMDSAVEKLEQALAFAPDYLEPLNDLAVLLMRKESYDRAEPLLRRAVVLDSVAWQPRLNLGIALLRRGAYAEAQQELEKAQRLGPGSPLPPFHLGRLHVMAGRPTDAESCFNQALEIQPQFPTAQLYRGYARIQAGRLPEARSDLVAYLEQAPNAEDAPRVKERLAEIDRNLPKR